MPRGTGETRIRSIQDWTLTAVALAATVYGVLTAGVLGGLTGIVVPVLVASGIKPLLEPPGGAAWSRRALQIGSAIVAVLAAAGGFMGGWRWGWAGGIAGAVIGMLLSRTIVLVSTPRLPAHVIAPQYVWAPAPRKTPMPCYSLFDVEKERTVGILVHEPRVRSATEHRGRLRWESAVYVGESCWRLRNAMKDGSWILFIPGSESRENLRGTQLPSLTLDGASDPISFPPLPDIILAPQVQE